MRFFITLNIISLFILHSAIATNLQGTVRLYSGKHALRTTEAMETIVYFQPQQPLNTRLEATPSSMRTYRKQFKPRILAITTGSTVRFPNQDVILHNVFSNSENNSFDAGIYSASDGVAQTFNNPGLVKVYCNVHHSMYGYILVLDTPYFTQPDTTGQFILKDLPDQNGTLIIYHDRAKPWKKNISVTLDTKPITVDINLNRRRVPEHHNKFGKPYMKKNTFGSY